MFPIQILLSEKLRPVTTIKWKTAFYLRNKTNMSPEKFERRVLITVVAVAGVAHDRLVTLTKACQQTNTPNTHTLSLSLSLLLHTSWCCMALCFRALIGSRIELKNKYYTVSNCRSWLSFRILVVNWWLLVARQQ